VSARKPRVTATITVATDRPVDEHMREVWKTNERGAQIRREREYVGRRVQALIDELTSMPYVNEGSPPNTPCISPLVIADILCNRGQQLRDDHERTLRIARRKGNRNGH
jgi:hypothetical protein